MTKSRKVTRVRLEDVKEGSLTILGIVSSEPDYKLSLLINRMTGLSLRNSPPVCLTVDKEEIQFSRFLSSGEHSATTHSLIRNRSETGLLFKQLRNIDYIFVISDPENEADEGLITSQLRNTESVTGVFNVKAELIKDRYFSLILN
jgi:hypothetical protein